MEVLLKAAWKFLASRVQYSACCPVRALELLDKSISAPLVPAVSSADTLLLCCLALLPQHRNCLVVSPVGLPWGKLSGSSLLNHSLAKDPSVRALHPMSCLSACGCDTCDSEHRAVCRHIGLCSSSNQCVKGCSVVHEASQLGLIHLICGLEMCKQQPHIPCRRGSPRANFVTLQLHSSPGKVIKHLSSI